MIVADFAEPGPLDTDRLAAIAVELERGLMHSAVLQHHPLGPLTTYRVGGAARVFVRVETIADLDVVAGVTARHKPEILIVGRGSNLLVADRGFAGLAIQLGDSFDHVQCEGTQLTAGAAASLPVVARQTVKQGLSEFEWAVGVPGSIGGAVRMNAGGHGSDMASSLAAVRVVDLHLGASSTMPAKGLGLGYRSSVIGHQQVVVEATLSLANGDPAVGLATLSEIVRWRRDNQPGGQNAGSVFTNPADDSAGRLIDAAGLKGHRLGSAEVSMKHANFIQSDPAGSADDIRALMGVVIDRVRAETGVELHPETHMVGFADGRWSQRAEPDLGPDAVGLDAVGPDEGAR